MNEWCKLDNCMVSISGVLQRNHCQYSITIADDTQSDIGVESRLRKSTSKIGTDF